MITEFELKQLRREIGASVSEMADLFGLSGVGAADQVRKMENGSKPITGPIQRLARYMQQGIGEGELAPLPRFLICAPMTGAQQPELVLHTRYPRFLAVVAEHPIDELMCATADPLEVEWLAVALWIDQPLHDPLPMLKQAAAEFAAYSQASMEANGEC